MPMAATAYKFVSFTRQQHRVKCNMKKRDSVTKRHYCLCMSILLLVGVFSYRSYSCVLDGLKNSSFLRNQSIVSGNTPKLPG